MSTTTPLGPLRPLGRHGLQVGPVGIGMAPVGNLYRAVPEEVWSRVVPTAWAGGVRYFDTAPHYGLGLSEQRLGLGLVGLPREQVIVSTKVGRLLQPQANPDGRRDDDEGFDVPADFTRVRDYSRDGVHRSLAASLERLGLDRVDLVFVHDPDEFEQQALRETFPALEDLRAQGVIRSYGAGMNSSAMLARFVRETDLDVVMVAGRYTLLDAGAGRDLLPACLERDVSVVAAGVFNSGLLAVPSPGADATFDYLPAPVNVLARARAVAEACRRHGTTLPAAAMAFPLRHPAVRTLCLGVRSAAEIGQNLGWLDDPVPDALWPDLVDRGLIDDPAVPLQS